jgi:hypothetical protein
MLSRHSVFVLRYGIPVRRITVIIFGGVAQIATAPPQSHGGVLDRARRPRLGKES